MSQSDRSYSEKRDFIRMRLEAQVTLRHAGEDIPATCIDLSSTGMQLEADTSLQIGEKVSVLIESSHAELESLHAEAEVVRVASTASGKQSLGLAIISMK
ncbi:PilZ domain-containing protein [Pseudomonas sp. Marseille-QA0892]